MGGVWLNLNSNFKGGINNEGRSLSSWKRGRQNQCFTFWLWVQHKEAPEGASFLPVFLQAKIVVNCLKYLVQYNLILKNMTFSWPIKYYCSTINSTGQIHATHAYCLMLLVFFVLFASSLLPLLYNPHK
jgi:hypothetical protein